MNNKRDNSELTLAAGFQQKINVMHAVVLRDIRSRAFNHGLGFLIVPFFPLAHLFVLLIFYKIIGRSVPFGEDQQLFFAIGLMPTLLFMYVSRFMSISVATNKSMMAFPAVFLLDIVFARAFLEFIGILLAILLVGVVLVIGGSDIRPFKPTDIVCALLATSLLAIGMGIIAGVITAIYPFFALIYALTMVLFYLSSGAIFYIYIFPVDIVQIASWNPLFHSVEWMRGGYYLGYPDQFLNKTYLIGFGMGSVALGLVMERLLRSQMLSS